MKKCKKCFIDKPLSNFCEFIAVTKNGKEKRRRAICYECNYKNVKPRVFEWAAASDKEKLTWIEKQFNRMVIKKDGCWDWRGFIRPDGYTRVKFGSRKTSVGGHVVSWMIKHKRIIKKGECILHKCDNRKCCNPKHVYLGTHLENSIDMLNRNRHPLIKLNVGKVKNIKNLIAIGVPLTKIAKKFNVHWATINDIKYGKTWKHVK